MEPEKQHILIFIDWFLPGYKAGGPIRSVANLIEALGDRYRFSVVTTDRDLGDEEGYPEIETETWIERDGYRIWYCSPDHRSYRHLRNRIFNEEYDLLYLQSMFSLRFSLFPLWIAKALRPEAGIVLAPRGMLHPGAFGLKTKKKKWFMRIFRLMQLQRGIVFQATDAQEVEDIRTHFPKALVSEAPNLPRMTLPALNFRDKEQGQLDLVFLSRLTVKKGLDLLLEALPKVHGQLKLDLYGVQDEPGFWEECLARVAALPERIQVSYRGTVPPQEVSSTLQGYHAFAMPTRGENFGHAIFESLAAGRPVVISEHSPWRNLSQQKAGWDLPLEAGAFAQSLQELVDMDQTDWQKWCEGARNLAQAYQEQLEAGAAYHNLFEQALETAKNP